MDLSHQNSNTFSKFVNALSNLKTKSTNVDRSAISKQKLKRDNTAMQDVATELATEDALPINTKPARSINEYGETEIQKKTQQQKHLSDEELIEIAEKYMSGYSTYELSQEYNCHRYTISNNLKRMGIDVSGHVEGRKYKTEEVIKLYVKEKKSVSEIARKFNVCDGTIYKCLKRNNISTNRTRWDYE